MRRDYRAIADRIINKRFTTYRRKVWAALEQAYEDGRADQRAEDDLERVIENIRRSVAAATAVAANAKRTFAANSNEITIDGSGPSMMLPALPPPSKIQREHAHNITRLRGVRIRRPH